ncbi:glycosyl hydrolase [Flavobacterium sediminilitoris]|uniref:Glycosyl hydrolase n=1 Tax=Flavobacterium sediminilitoris TaxID=2024526 RepID=A0ABY4HSH1_9FLAO|nr:MULTISPECIES: sialidase family protein [Flavobacterium]UOX34729.1 glycosyl hydrolase [Flavobacterium sediminilitoris]
MKNKIVLLFLVFQSFIWAQTDMFSDVELKSIGPTIMSGRIVDLAVNPENPTEFYAAYASGGLWYTKNNGMSFEPVMDEALTQNCGSVTVDWKTGTIWVGTGEVNSSRSSYAGIGVLKSTDKGKTWTNIGLQDSHHISRIWVNPKNNNEIVVAALGHLYTSNDERGVFKTIDGGKTWKKALFINKDTGIIDLSVAPNNSNIMYAAAWERERKAWNFKGNGESSGIYKSEDAGSTWKLISTKESGFPNNVGVGRIGLAAFNENVIYAVLDNQNNRPQSTISDKSKLPMPEMFSAPGEVFIQKSNKEINAYLKKHGLREKYRAQTIKNWVEKGEMQPSEVKKVLQDANKALFETEVIGCEIYKSIDGGKSWKRTHDDFIDDMYYSYGYYFGIISVDPSNENRIYMGGVPLLFSEDGGKTIVSINKDNVHADHHVTWVNPKNPNHIINGNDGGINISYDNGEHWIKCNNNAVGQFYAVNIDYNNSYNVYGGLQDNGVWVGNNNYYPSTSWHQDGKYPYESLMGGDGMQIQIDNRNPDIVFTGYQFGNYYRIDRSKNKMDFISPKAKKDEKPLRFNWQTPILLSSHNQDILYMGSNFLHRSMNQGETWEKISPDLTKGAVEGNVAFGTITSFSESKIQFGLFYVGSDDGLIHVSKDGGATWQKISNNLPQNLWVSRVKASAFKKERVYVTLNGYRNDDFKSYVYVSDDYGITWQDISANLPQSPVNVILEDTENENLLFVGTDNGLFVSLNKGKSWEDFSSEMPNVAVHDLVIQPKAKELIVGTHGRSLYKVGIDELQKLTSDILNKSLFVYEVPSIKKSERWGNSWSQWGKPYEPKTEIWFYSNSNEEVEMIIENEKGIVVFSKKITAKKGLNLVNYDYTLSDDVIAKWKKKDKKAVFEKARNGKQYVLPAKYSIHIKKGNETVFTNLEVVENKKA